TALLPSSLINDAIEQPWPCDARNWWFLPLSPGSFRGTVCTLHWFFSPALRKIESPNDQSDPVTGGDHLPAGNLPLVSVVVAEEIEQSRRSQWCNTPEN